MQYSQKRDYTRGQLAKGAAVNIETIRFYEKIGLMPDPPRNQAGYRIYNEEHLKRLQFIRRTHELGFTNAEIQSLLEMVDGLFSCDEVREIALEQAHSIKQKIQDLAKLEETLRDMATECKGGTTPECAIIDQLLE